MTKIIWAKTETRQVRPFFSLSELESCLDGAEIQLFEGQGFSSGEAFVLPQDDLAKVAPALRPNLVVPDLRRLGFGHSDLSLLVCLVGPHLKKTEVLLKLSLSEQLPDVISVDQDKVLSIGGADGMQVKLGVCLNRELPQVVGRPFHAGHWVAKKTFRISPAKESNQFEVRPRTDAEWLLSGYPEKTLFSVEYTAGMNEPASKDSSIAQVWIHSSVFNRMALDPDSKKNRAFMAMMSSEITIQLLLQSYQDWKDAPSVTPNSPLSAVIKQLGSPGKFEFTRLKQLVEDPGQPKLRALIQNQQLTVRSLMEA